jgi:hypothetical protein
MGIIKQGILGGFSGKVGNVVGTSWKGRAVLKAMPLSVANPRTTGQINQRAKFSACVELAKELLGGSIAILDNPFAGNISGYNRFVKRNTAAFTTDGNLIPNKLKVSEGALGGIELDGPVQVASGGVSIGIYFDSLSSPYNLGTDNVVATIISKTTGEVLVAGRIIAKRADNNGAAVPIRPLEANEEFYVYLSAIRVDKKYVSDSVYSLQQFA